MTRVGLIGLGKMGLPMGRNLLKSGFPLVVHNRSRGAVDDLAGSGAESAASPAEVASRSDVVLTCLPDVPAVQQVYLGDDGLLEEGREGKLFVDHSTVSPDLSRKLSETANSKGASFLDAPVSGGTAGAANATLTIMIGGHQEAFDRARPIFEALGKSIHHVGGNGSGAAIKLANQLLVGVHTVAAMEALVLVAKAGADPRTALEVISSSFGSSAMLARHGPMVLERKFDGGTPVDLILKDLRLIEQTADGLSMRLLAASLAKELFSQAQDFGIGGQDMSAMVQPLEQSSGVTVSSASV